MSTHTQKNACYKTPKSASCACVSKKRWRPIGALFWCVSIFSKQNKVMWGGEKIFYISPTADKQEKTLNHFFWHFPKGKNHSRLQVEVCCKKKSPAKKLSNIGLKLPRSLLLISVNIAITCFSSTISFFITIHQLIAWGVGECAQLEVAQRKNYFRLRLCRKLHLTLLKTYAKTTSDVLSIWSSILPSAGIHTSKPPVRPKIHFSVVCRAEINFFGLPRTIFIKDWWPFIR